MSDENKAVVQRFYEVWMTGDIDVIDEIVAEDAIDHDPYNPNGHDGVAGQKKTMSMYREAFPDLHFTIEDQIAEGDKVVTRWTATGTHQGEVMGIPASGKTSTVTGVTIDRIENGKVVEGWTNWDTLAMLQQIGGLAQQEEAPATS